MDKTSFDPVSINCRVTGVSHKAVEVIIDDSQTTWIPRSLIYSKVYGDDNFISMMTIPRWYAEKYNIKHEEVKV